MEPDSGEIVWSEETYRIFEYDKLSKANDRFGGAARTSGGTALVQQVIDRASQTGRQTSNMSIACCCLTGESSTSMR